MSDDLRYGPWHTLRLTASVWYCDHVAADDPAGCVPAEECQGHDTPHDGRINEQDREFDHPEECPVPDCCCKIPAAERLPGFQIDPDCEAGHHDSCLSRGYRCYTEENLHEWWDVSEMPTEAGVYRVRAWGSGPDWQGEYDGGIEWEPVTEAVAT